MRDILKDMVKVVRAADIGTIKITGTDGLVTFQGVDDKRSVILKGSVIKEDTSFEGVSGIGDLDRLAGMLNYFDMPNDVVSVARKMRQVRNEKKDADGNPILDAAGVPEFETAEENAIERFTFNRSKPSKADANFRVIARNLIPQQFSPKEVEYAVEITPTASAISDLEKLVSIANSDTFSVKIQPNDDGTNSLFVNLGVVGNESSIEFHKDVDGVLKNSWNWDITKVLKLLKLGTTTTLRLGFSDRGMLKVTIDSGIANYEFTIPPRQQ